MLELAKIPFTEVARFAESGNALVILPVGVVEEHAVYLLKYAASAFTWS